jgi:hypothetical protein
MRMFAWRRRLGRLVSAAVVVVLVAPAAARAEPPTFTSDPMIHGDAVVGSTLQVDAAWTVTTPPSVATYTWSRCPMATPCMTVSTTPTNAYTVTTADLGSQLKALVTLTSGADVAMKETALTAAVVAAPPPPPPDPTPPTLTPSPSPPAPAPVRATTTAVAFSSVTPSVVSPAPPGFLRPFPVVRIRGFFARRGARVTLLSVRGPRSAKVEVKCSGRGCPVSKLSLPRADTRVHRFERFLRAGILLQIRVTRPGRIGAYTSFLIRAQRSPLRRDRCLSAVGARPIRCSAP